MSTQLHVASQDPGPAEAPRDPLSLDFILPPHLEASEPPEVRGRSRADVRLLVTSRSGNQIRHRRFADIVDLLAPGDLLVINTSGTLNASLPATREGDEEVEFHLSTRLPGDIWTVEVRNAAGPIRDLHPGEVLGLRGGAGATIHALYRSGCGHARDAGRLWLASLTVPCDLHCYLGEFGKPIRYGYVRDGWPNEYYQTVYVTEMGSAEMPSAGRPFTPELLSHLVARGVIIAPLLLHTGVASLESHEPPYEEYYRVPAATAELVNLTRERGRRVIAVGTTVVRALETVAERDRVHAGEGWTCLVVEPRRGLRVVDGLLTGLHEPRSSHLLMLEAFTDRPHLRRAYQAALAGGYLWHEFGDLHLLLP